MSEGEFILPEEPRLKGEFRIYRLRAGELVWLGSVRTAKGMGEWLVRLYDEGEFGVDDCVGVKRERGTDPESGIALPGEWIVHPFNIGRSRRIGEPDELGEDWRCRALSVTENRRCRKRATHAELCDTHYRMLLRGRGNVKLVGQ